MTNTQPDQDNSAEIQREDKASAGSESPRALSPAAKRALAEAEERRSRLDEERLPPEQGGPAGLEPTRFGDWERKGIASDF